MTAQRPARPARPVAPFTAIVAISRTVWRDGEPAGYAHVRFEEIEAFDVRDAWMQAEDAAELSSEETEREQLVAHVQGVTGPGGWTVAPAWVNPAVLESPEARDVRIDAHFRALDDGAAFVA